MKASKRRGKARVHIFLPDYFYPYKNVIACTNVCLTTYSFVKQTLLTLSLGQENMY